MKSGVFVARMAAAVVVVSCATATSSMAEGTASNFAGTTDVGVMDRVRPAYDAKGINLGGFRLFPSLDTSATFDDNIFRTNTPVSDWYFTVAPTARLRSDWGRHSFELYGGVNDYNYTKYSGENLTDWVLGTDGRYDLSRAANITATVSYGQQHELWSAPNNDVGFQAAPNRYFQTHADVSSVYQPNRLGFALGGVYDHYNWTNTPKNGGGYLFNNDRDQDEFQAYAKAYYDFSPGYSGYLKASYDERDFDQPTDRSGLHRSSHGYRVDGGVNLQISHLVSGEIFLGYLQQNFADPTLKDISGFDYGVQLDWYVSPLLTAHLSGKRTLENVVLAGVSAADDKSISLGADYEFRPNIIVQAHMSYSNTKYVGQGRTDDYPSAGVGVKYLLNRYASLDVNYNYSNRSTANSAFEYTSNTVSLGLTLHL